MFVSKSRSALGEVLGLSGYFPAVSEENVELMKQGVDAFNRGDMNGMLALMDPELEFVTAGLFPGTSPFYRGHDGWVTFWRDFRETWESLSIETNEFRFLRPMECSSRVRWAA